MPTPIDGRLHRGFHSSTIDDQTYPSVAISILRPHARMRITPVDCEAWRNRTVSDIGLDVGKVWKCVGRE